MDNKRILVAVSTSKFVYSQIVPTQTPDPTYHSVSSDPAMPLTNHTDTWIHSLHWQFLYNAKVEALSSWQYPDSEETLLILQPALIWDCCTPGYRKQSRRQSVEWCAVLRLLRSLSWRTVLFQRKVKAGLESHSSLCRLLLLLGRCVRRLLRNGQLGLVIRLIGVHYTISH